MAKSKKKTVEELSRKEINGNIFVFYSDGSITIIPAPIKLEKEEVENLFEEEDSEEEEEEEESDNDEDDPEEDSEEEELTGEQLAEMDFEELEDLCDENDLETDPDDFDEDDIESFRKALAKELGITLPKKATKKEATKKGKKK